MTSNNAVLEILPSLESIVVQGKYKIFSGFPDFLKAITPVVKEGPYDLFNKIGESANFEYKYKEYIELDQKKKFKDYFKARVEALSSLAAGTPFSLYFTTVDHLPEGIVIEVQCLPVMYFLVTQVYEHKFSYYEIEDALFKCKRFIKNIMSAVRAKEVLPVSVYPIIQRREIKNRLSNLGLKALVKLLDRAERHVTQNNFEASLKASRTAFEKSVDWQMKRCRLGMTNSYKSNLERLRKKGVFDKDTTEFLEDYYRYISCIGVHERGDVPVGIFEAQMGYGITLIILDYFTKRIS